MAKWKTLAHPKTLALMRALKSPLYEAVGVLETMWLWSGQYAPQGDIGRHSNAVIAEAIGWDGDHDELVLALVSTGWLDEDETHRLVIHDWHEHADRLVSRFLERHHLPFVSQVGGKVAAQSHRNGYTSTSTSTSTKNTTSTTGGSGRGDGVDVAGEVEDPLTREVTKTLLEVPAFTAKPPRPTSMVQLVDDYRFLGPQRLVGEARTARDWALGADRYAKPGKAGNAASFFRSWLKKFDKERPEEAASIKLPARVAN